MSAASPSVTPAAAWELLASGNRRFVDGTPRHPHQSQWRRGELSTGQAPFVTVLSCSDSRVPPEIVFDRGLGDVFTVRTAGQVLDSAVLGTVEYGVEHTHTPLLAVLGHQACGCVKAAAECAAAGVTPGGYIDHLVEGLAPALAVCKETGTTNLDEIMEENVRQVVHGLMTNSSIVAKAVADGSLAVVGLTYRLSDGTVSLLDWIGDIGRGRPGTLQGAADVVRAQADAASSAVARVDGRTHDTVEAEVVEDDLESASR